MGGPAFFVMRGLVIVFRRGVVFRRGIVVYSSIAVCRGYADCYALNRVKNQKGMAAICLREIH